MKIRDINAFNAWMTKKKENRPKQTWNTETKKWEHREIQL